MHDRCWYNLSRCSANCFLQSKVTTRHRVCRFCFTRYFENYHPHFLCCSLIDRLPDQFSCSFFAQRISLPLDGVLVFTFILRINLWMTYQFVHGLCGPACCSTFWTERTSWRRPNIFICFVGNAFKSTRRTLKRSTTITTKDSGIEMSVRFWGFFGSAAFRFKLRRRFRRYLSLWW